MATNKWVNDCQLDADLEIGFPEDYVENISERISLYRELDGLTSESELLDFKKRLIDRFGTLPEKAEELLSVLQLRWLCMKLGIEKVALKQDRMILYFPSNQNSPYYQSDDFGKVLQYIANHPRRCQFRHVDVRRSVSVANVISIRTAFDILNEMI